MGPPGRDGRREAQVLPRTPTGRTQGPQPCARGIRCVQRGPDCPGRRRSVALHESESFVRADSSWGADGPVWPRGGTSERRRTRLLLRAVDLLAVLRLVLLVDGRPVLLARAAVDRLLLPVA